ncbi:MAG: thioredoxin family protein [Syntrophothermus sp.]
MIQANFAEKRMSRSILFIFLFFCHGWLQAQPGKEEKSPAPSPRGEKIKWYSFEDAYQLSKKNPKKMFVDVYTDWCGWCKKMDAETFTNPVIAKYMNKNFYCVKLDAERKDSVIIDGVVFDNPGKTSRRSTHKLAVELLNGSMSYPSYVFLNEKSQRITVINGYRVAKEFEVILHYFGDDAYTKMPWEEFQPGFTGTIK